MAQDNIQDWMDWASGTVDAGAGDLLLSREEIEDIVDGVMASLGEFHTDTSDIPTTASARARGLFDSPNDLRDYLEGGRLISYDAGGGPHPSSIVHILKHQPANRSFPAYEVWVDDETDP